MRIAEWGLKIYVKVFERLKANDEI
jgi:hypothetical protein